MIQSSKKVYSLEFFDVSLDFEKSIYQYIRPYPRVVLEKEQGNLGFQLLPKKKLKVSCTRKIDAGFFLKMSEPYPGYTGSQTL